MLAGAMAERLAMPAAERRPCHLESLRRVAQLTDAAQIGAAVKEGYSSVGHLLDGMEDAVLLVDALCLDGPIVGASAGFTRLTQYTLEELLGNNCRLLLDGVPETAISKSARKNIQDYCRTCLTVGIEHIAETSSVQPNRRRDGSMFVNFFMLGLCMVRDHPYILAVQLCMGEGMFVRLTSKDSKRYVEDAREVFRRTRDVLRSSSSCSAVASCLEKPLSRPQHTFYSARLQDHCLLISQGATAIRREPTELATGSMVFGSKPVQKTHAGLCFSVQVDMVTTKFVGFPYLGFTRKQPEDNPDLYPLAMKCLGQSVIVGGMGEATARDQLENYVMGFKKPPADDISVWLGKGSAGSAGPSPKDSPCELRPGDVLQCCYTHDGHIQMSINGILTLDFNVERPIDQAADYYAVVDVSYSVFCLTMLSSPTDARYAGGNSTEGTDVPASMASISATCDILQPDTFMREVSFGASSASSSSVPERSARCERCDEGSSEENLTAEVDAAMLGLPVSMARNVPAYIDGTVRAILSRDTLEKVARKAVSDFNFCVSIADPRGLDCPLIAVSTEFEEMTGFKSDEILGVNCRFLNYGCNLDPDVIMNLRHASFTGSPYTSILHNRKKSGEKFMNLLALRGLTVATNPGSGEELWFLIGLQADVTSLMVEHEEIPQYHLARLEQVTNSLRTEIAKELSLMAVAGASTASHEQSALPSPDSWFFLQTPRWKVLEHMVVPPSPVSSLSSALRPLASRAGLGGEAKKRSKSAAAGGDTPHAAAALEASSRHAAPGFSRARALGVATLVCAIIVSIRMHRKA